MKLGYDSDGQAYVARYEPGDLVRLCSSERGEGLTGKVGDWGKVVAVDLHSERVDIEVAGYSHGRHSGLKRLTGLPKRILMPCDRTGALVPLPRTGLFRLDATMTRKLPTAR